jgi:hypothetical protein
MAKTYVNTCETVDKKVAGYLAVSDILLHTQGLTNLCN